MRPLTLDDLLPLDEYAGRRREFFDSHTRYLDRYRRVRIGPSASLLFENRQTLWFRVQEILRIARLAEPGLVQQELDLYNRLLPGRGLLQAAVLIEAGRSDREGQAAPWNELRGESVRLCAGPHRQPATLVTARPEDRCVGTAHWVRFPIDAETRSCLADNRQTAGFEIACGAYQHASTALSEDLRQSLLDDLALSDRDG
jgi:hypothetical protein